MGLAISVALAVTAFAVVDPHSGRPSDQFGVVIESPYVGEGVAAGTALLMHGVKVGEVTQVSSLPGGGVRLAADLRQGPTAGLTNAMTIDFRPANYFGVTGINLLPGPGAADIYNDFAFALPGGAKDSYFELKSPLIAARLADLAPLWGME